MAQKAGSPPLVTLANDDGTPYNATTGPITGTVTVVPSTGALADRSGTITVGIRMRLG